MKRAIAGFTLLEILLVLVLMSLASVAVIATLPVSGEDSAKTQAQALYHRLQLLNEEAMLSGTDFGIHIDEEKSRYQLLRLTQQGWQKLEQPNMTDQVELAADVVLEFELGGSVWKDQQRLFKPGSLFDEEMFAEYKQEQKQPPPQVFIMSSGEVTPFSMTIYPRGRSAEHDAWRILAKENGQILLLPPGERDEQS